MAHRCAGLYFNFFEFIFYRMFLYYIDLDKDRPRFNPRKDVIINSIRRKRQTQFQSKQLPLNNTILDGSPEENNEYYNRPTDRQRLLNTSKNMIYFIKIFKSDFSS